MPLCISVPLESDHWWCCRLLVGSIKALSPVPLVFGFTECMYVAFFVEERVTLTVSDHVLQVVDFLILVGGLEESCRSKGDSAEMALAVSDNNEEKVYLI